MTTIILLWSSRRFQRLLLCVISIFQISVTQRCRINHVSSDADIPQYLARAPLITLRPLLRALACLLLASPLSAQTFAELESKLQQHPQLQAIAFQVDSERELSNAAMALPDPIISLAINNFPILDPSFDTFLPTNKAIGIQQRLLNKATRRARAATIEAQADQSVEMGKQLFASLRAQLIALLHDKVRIKEQRSLAQQRDIKYDQLSDVIASEIGAGRASFFRLAEIEAERAEVSRSLADLEAQKTQVNARLVYLLGSVPETGPPAIEPIYLPNESLDFHASRVAGSALNVSASSIDEAKAAWKPEWGTQLTYQQREAGINFDGDDWVSMMVTFTVPFWANGKQAPNLRAANARQRAAQAMVVEAQRQAFAQYSYAKANHLGAKETVDILEQKIIAIKEEIAAQQSNYESGAGVYAPIIDGEIAILKLQAEVVAEMSRSQIAAAKMNSLLVTP